MNFAFIGCGKIAIEHARVVNSLGHKILLCHSKTNNSKNWKNFRKKDSNIKYVKKLDDILNNKKVDFIIVCISWNQTEKILPKLLSSEKPMLLEKPIAFKSNFLKKLLKKNKKNCKNKFVGFNRRFYKTTQKLYKRLLKNDLIYADIRVTENYNEIINKYGSKIKNRINYVTATTHVIDLVIFLFGQLRIKSLKIIKAKKNKCSSFFANCRNKKNIIVNISIFNQNPSNTGITCYFSDGTTWDLSPLEVLSIYDKYNVQTNKKNKLRFYEPSLLRKYSENDNKYKPGFYNQLSSITKKKIQYASSIDSNINLLKFFDNLKRNEK